MKAVCACGAVSALIEGTPQSVGLCHCDACRTRTGSAFSLNARFSKSAVTQVGVAKKFTRIGDDGGEIIYAFCTTCGVTVWYENSNIDGIMIPVGAIDDAQAINPNSSVYHDRCPNWLSLSGVKVIS